jgi:gas vesicle protein
MEHDGISGRLRRVAAWLAAVSFLSALAVQPKAALGRARTVGGIVIVTTGTGTVKGELIGVREDALVVMSAKGDDTIPIAEIDSVTIVRRAPAVRFGMILGGVVGAAVGALAAPRTNNDASIWRDFNNFGKLLGRAGIGCLIGAMAGVLTATVIAKDKVVVLKGKTKEETPAALKDLKKEARVSDYR